MSHPRILEKRHFTVLHSELREETLPSDRDSRGLQVVALDRVLRPYHPVLCPGRVQCCAVLYCSKPGSGSVRLVQVVMVEVLHDFASTIDLNWQQWLTCIIIGAVG